jgi:ribosome maturation factor RimP
MLEVSSPGLERNLRTPAHHRWALGKQVRIKTVAGLEGDRRVEGTLAEADEGGVTIALPGAGGATRRLAYADIERARTVFEWGPGPKPGAKQPEGAKKAKGAKQAKGAKGSPAAAKSAGPSDEMDEPIPGHRDEGHDKEAKVESS